MEPNATDYEKGERVIFWRKKKMLSSCAPHIQKVLNKKERERERGGKTMTLEPKVPFYWLLAANDLERMREGNLR